MLDDGRVDVEVQREHAADEHQLDEERDDIDGGEKTAKKKSGNTGNVYRAQTYGVTVINLSVVEMRKEAGNSCVQTCEEKEVNEDEVESGN